MSKTNEKNIKISSYITIIVYFLTKKKTIISGILERYQIITYFNQSKIYSEFDFESIVIFV